MNNGLLPIDLAVPLVPLVALLAGCANSPATKIGEVPESLRVPAGSVLTQQARAQGVQIYRCSPGKDDPGHFAWALKEPAADLFDHDGKKIGKHYAGPTWEAKDGSTVTGEVVARVDGPDPNGVAWLLLKAKSAQGSGIFARVRYVQRLHTAGGSAPAEGCNQASVGRETSVPYSAEYWFYADKS